MTLPQWSTNPSDFGKIKPLYDIFMFFSPRVWLPSSRFVEWQMKCIWGHEKSVIFPILLGKGLEGLERNKAFPGWSWTFSSKLVFFLIVKLYVFNAWGGWSDPTNEVSSVNTCHVCFRRGVAGSLKILGLIWWPKRASGWTFQKWWLV